MIPKPQLGNSPCIVLGAISGQANATPTKATGRRYNAARRNAYEQVQILCFSHFLCVSPRKRRRGIAHSRDCRWTVLGGPVACAPAAAHRPSMAALRPCRAVDTKAAAGGHEIWVASRREHENALAKHSSGTNAIHRQRFCWIERTRHPSRRATLLAFCLMLHAKHKPDSHCKTPLESIWISLCKQST